MITIIFLFDRKTWDSKNLALITQMARAFGTNPKAWVSLKSRHFLSQKFRHFNKIICLWVEMNAVDGAQLAFQMLTLLQKYLNRQSQH